jgi:hypothetical protein
VAEGQFAVQAGFFGVTGVGWVSADCCAGAAMAAQAAAKREAVKSDRSVVRTTIVDILPGCCLLL